MTTKRATIIGFSAVVLWALLALLTVATDPVPPLQLNAMCFGIGGSVGLAWLARSGQFYQLRNVPVRVYIFGTTGLFGYHFLYFSALRNAPAAEAGLIAYLWPLLIVLFSGLLPGEKLRIGHMVGGLISFAGAAIIVTGSKAGFEIANLSGYLLAACCAVVWSTYSVLSRRAGEIPTATVAIFCCATAVLSCIAHLATEQTVWPHSYTGWLSVLALGIGPVGLAFYVWDIGIKQGDIQLLGVASYAAPLLSTVTLILAGITQPSLSVLLAAVFISAGALLAAKASSKTANLPQA